MIPASWKEVVRRWLGDRRRRAPAVRRPARSRAHRISMESLEGRLTPSTFAVTSAADNAGAPRPGTLRAAIAKANQPGNQGATIEITPAVTSQVISLSAGELKIKSSLSIVNASGHPVTIQQATKTPLGSQNARVFHVLPIRRASSLNISGLDATNTLTIAGGSVTGGNGGGIRVDNPSNHLTLSHVNVTGNTAKAAAFTATIQPGSGNGGGIYTRGAVTLSQSNVTSNTVSGAGGGVWAGGGVALDASAIDGNSAHDGGGVLVSLGDVTLDRGSSVSSNRALSGASGGIAVASGSVSVLNGSHVDGNQAHDIGGIMAGNGNVSVLGGSTVSGNASTGGRIPTPGDIGGGGIVANFGSVTLSASRVNGNATAGMLGGGVAAALGDVNVLDGSQVRDNTNNGPGGGIASYFGGSVNVGGAGEVVGNTGAAIGGGIANFSGSLGGVTVSGGGKVDNNTVTNAATLGQVRKVFTSFANGDPTFRRLANEAGGRGGANMLGALRQVAGAASRSAAHLRLNSRQLPAAPSTLQAGGGIGTLLGAPVTITGGSEVNGNRSGVLVPGGKTPSLGIAGGIFAPRGPLAISQSTVNGNAATGSGGGIWNGGTLTLSAATAAGNVVSGGTVAGLANASGGGLFNAAGAKASVLDSSIQLNQAVYGGGIANSGRLTVDYGTIAQNKATVDGGGIYNKGMLTQSNVLFSGNTPNTIAPPQG